MRVSGNNFIVDDEFAAAGLTTDADILQRYCCSSVILSRSIDVKSDDLSSSQNSFANLRVTYTRQRTKDYLRSSSINN